MKKIISIIMVLVIILAACSSEGEEIGGDLTVVVPFSDAEEVFSDVKDKFMEKYPDVTSVTFEGQTTDYDSYIATRMSSGNYGDAFVVPFSMTSEPETLPEYITPLDKTEDLAKEYSFADYAQYEGESYALPISVNSLGAIYNKAVFEEVGITEFPTSTDGILEACELIQSQTDSSCWYSNLNSLPQLWGGALTTYGGEDYEEQILNAGTVVEEGQPHREIFDLIYQMITKGYTESDIAAGDMGESFAGVANGDYAFIIGGSQMLEPVKQMATNSDDIVMTGFPYLYEGEVAIPFGADSIIGVSNKSENSATAKAFVEFIASEESGYAFSNGGVPAKLNDEGEYILPESMSNLEGLKTIRTIANSTPEVTTKYNEVMSSAGMARIAQPIEELVNLSVNDGDYEAFLSELEANFESSLGE